MKTIAVFDKSEEAHLLRMRLEAGGIAAYVQNEHVAQLNPFYTIARGGVRVEVADEDEEEAREWIADDEGVDPPTEG